MRKIYFCLGYQPGGHAVRLTGGADPFWIELGEARTEGAAMSEIRSLPRDTRWNLSLDSELAWGALVRAMGQLQNRGAHDLYLDAAGE